MSMLHDGILSRATRRDAAVDDRREGDRVPYPAELVLAWMHDLDMSVRCRVLDAGDGGFRIRTAMPLVEGTTGIALRLLPEGHPIDRSVMVVWIGEVDEHGEREVGLRYF